MDEDKPVAEQHAGEEQSEEEASEGDSDEVDECRKRAWAYANEVIELVATNKVNMTGAQHMLRATREHYAEVLDEDCEFPGSWYMCAKYAEESQQIAPTHIVRHFCPDCDYMFPESPSETICEECNQNTRFSLGRPARPVPYFDLSEKIERLYSAKYAARHMSYGPTLPPPDANMADRELTDCWDAAILEELHHNSEFDDGEKSDYIYFALSCDGVEKTKRSTYTPVTVKVLNLPIGMRGKACVIVLFHTYNGLLCTI